MRLKNMVPVKVGEKFDYEAVNIDSDWNDSNDSELIMHTIHSYPAKFPAFIAWKHLNTLKMKV